MSKREKRLLESPLSPLGELPKMWNPEEGRVMGAEEMMNRKGVMVMTEKGSIRGKFRYFVVFGIADAKLFSEEQFKKLLDDDFWKQAVEVERVHVEPTHVILTLLIAPTLAPLDYIADHVGKSKREKIPIYKSFLIGNGAAPTARDIRNYLADFKSS